jgi:mRNA interferase RelE/StbE
MIYELYVLPEALDEVESAPGHVRQQIRRAIRSLAHDPRPSTSKQLELLDERREVRRLRLDRWRVIYVVSEADGVVDVFAVRKRPPYDYGDLSDLLARAS